MSILYNHIFQHLFPIPNSILAENAILWKLLASEETCWCSYPPTVLLCVLLVQLPIAAAWCVTNQCGTVTIFFWWRTIIKSNQWPVQNNILHDCTESQTLLMLRREKDGMSGSLQFHKNTETPACGGAAQCTVPWPLTILNKEKNQSAVTPKTACDSAVFLRLLMAKQQCERCWAKLDPAVGPSSSYFVCSAAPLPMQVAPWIC